jgi:hypothetical protein
MQVSKNFHIKELVPKEFYKLYGRLSTRAIDKRIIFIAQYLRDKFGRVVVNGTLNGIEYNESGLRIPHQEYYSFGSDHARGTALDLKFTEANHKEVIKFILGNKEIFIPMGLTALEINTNGWVHISCANYMASDIVIFDNNKRGEIINREVL